MKKIFIIALMLAVFNFTACSQQSNTEVEELRGEVDELRKILEMGDEDEGEEIEEDGTGGPDLEAELVEKEEEITELKEKLEELEADEEVEAEPYTGESFMYLTTPIDGAGFSVDPIEFKGVTSPNTEGMVVTAYQEPGYTDGVDDEYQLQNFELGDEEFVYRAALDYNNLDYGPVNYEFKAFFTDGSTAVDTINISYLANGITADEFITLDSPFENQMFNGDENFTIEFTGRIPINTTKIDVVATGGFEKCDPKVNTGCTPYYKDVYTLKDFTHGDADFVYRARKTLGNLTIGKNTYEFTATYDDGSQKSVVRNIFFQE